MLKKSLNVNTNVLPQGLEARSHGGMAYKNTLGIPCPPSFERISYEAINLTNGIPSGLTFTRASAASYVAPRGHISNMGAASGVLRHEWDSVTGEYKGILLEPATTNLCLQSEVSGTTWSLINCTLTANSVVSPDWTQSADTLQVTSSGACYIFQVVTVAATANYTFSSFFKAGTSSWAWISMTDGTGAGKRQYVNLTTGKLGSTETVGSGLTSTSSSITPMYNGWYRVSLTVTTASNTALTVFCGPALSDVNIAATTGQNVYWWGAQLEAGVLPTSYIATTTAAVARAADSLTITTAALPGYNPYEGTLYAEAVAVGVPGLYPGVLSLDDGTTNNQVANYLTLPNLQTAIITGNVAQVNQVFVNNGAVQAGSVFRFATGYSTNYANVSVNGIIGTAKTSGITIPTVTTLRYGGVNGALSYPIYIKHIAYFPRRIADTDLIKLTT